MFMATATAHMNLVDLLGRSYKISRSWKRTLDDMLSAKIKHPSMEQVRAFAVHEEVCRRDS